GPPPVDGVPVGSSLGSVCRAVGLHPTCPSIGGLRGALRVAHQVHVSSLSARAIGPYPPGYDFPLPFGWRRSLLGPSFARRGLGLPRGRLPGSAGPRRGCHVPLRRDASGWGALSTPGPWCPDGAATAAPSWRGENGHPAPGPALSPQPPCGNLY